MEAKLIERNVVQVAPSMFKPLYEDPLDEDTTSDEIVVTTRRGLLRLATVASETGSRFAREGVEHDPVAWLLAPRRLFDGEAAIDACLTRDGCLRGILLHGLSLGLDADPDEVDALSEEDDEESFQGEMDEVSHPTLWTSYISDHTGGGFVHAFDAVIASTRAEAVSRLSARHGADLIATMEIEEGFDPSRPLAEALVSPAVADMLSHIAGDPSSPLAAGLSVSIEQRFAA